MGGFPFTSHKDQGFKPPNHQSKPPNRRYLIHPVQLRPGCEKTRAILILAASHLSPTISCRTSQAALGGIGLGGGGLLSSMPFQQEWKNAQTPGESLRLNSGG